MVRVVRKTRETSIELKLKLRGNGSYKISTTLPFFDHMLENMARHGYMDLYIKAEGDTHIDEHHLVEDVGIVLGQAIYKEIKNKKGIRRFSQVITPLDEALNYIAIDVSDRPYFDWDVKFKIQNKAPFQFELFEDFFRAIAMNSRITLHIRQIKGKNNHHISETIFKGFGRALRDAVEKVSDKIPSTKGVI